MSERERNLKQDESSVASRRNAESAGEHRADLPRRVDSSGLAALPNRLWQAGNRAVSRLLGGRDGGKPLAQQTKAEMERSFNADFSDVRIHQDSASQAAADSLNATAFAHGDDVYLGADAPSPESPAGRALLAHELAHVVQQQEAGAVAPELSRPGDRFEQSADRAAQQAMQGNPAESADAGAPPAIQRQQKPENAATREEAQAAIEAFLRRAMREQGSRSVRVTPEVRSAIISLFAGDLGRSMGIEAWLKSPALPGDPADFARQVAQRLPETIERSRLEQLKRMSGQTSGKSSVLGRAQEVFEREAPGGPEREEEKEAEKIAKGQAEPTRTRINASGARTPGTPTAEERVEQVEQLGRRIRGEQEPTTIGPFSVDLSRLGRVIGSRKEIIEGPIKPRPVAPEARTYPEVEKAIQQLAPDALIPAEARGTSKAAGFADARLMASDLARRLDVAQQQGQESVELRLGNNYNSARDRAEMIAEINRVIQLIRDALPHHATDVKFVDVYFGEKLVTRGMARRAE